MFAIIFLVAHKRRELNTGATLISFNGKVDNFVNTQKVFVKKIVTEFPKHFGREALYTAVHKSIKINNKVKELLHPKIGHIIESVKGKHFPKSKGESSSFLVHIEKHKEKEAVAEITVEIKK